MKEKVPFYAADRKVWRSWLINNYKTADEIWLVFPSKETGETAISYNDAVEEALCFGWIDSTAGKLDDMHGLRRFGKRKDNGYFSRINIERLIWLNSHDMIIDEIKSSILHLINEEFVFPEDIIHTIQSDDLAWKNFQNFSEPYKRIRISHIESARNDMEEFSKRLNTFVKKTHDNKLIKGFGADEKYYK